MIYFIESQGMVKIGYSNDPKRRLRMLATGCPFVCTLIGVTDGGMEEERHLHERFTHLRSRGEWFNFTPEINAYLSENAISIEPKKQPTFDHPLAVHVASKGQTMAAFARRAGVSRVTLYRLIKGEQNATIDLLSKISAATNGDVPATAFMNRENAA